MNKFIKNVWHVISIWTAICLYSCNLGAGSYPYSEVYYINLASSDDLIHTINKFKHNNQELNVYYVNEQKDTVIMDEFTPNYYICRFLKDDIVYMCAINTNQQNQKHVALQFVSICKKNKIDRGGHWKDINTDKLTKNENEIYKRKFEKIIIISQKNEVTMLFNKMWEIS